MTREEANNKAREIYEYGRQFFQGKAEVINDDGHPAGMTAIAEHYGGTVEYTGGGIFCAVIPVDETHALGINDEAAVLYESDEPASAVDIFWNYDHSGEENDDGSGLFFKVYE